MNAAPFLVGQRVHWRALDGQIHPAVVLSQNGRRVRLKVAMSDFNGTEMREIDTMAGRLSERRKPSPWLLEVPHADVSGFKIEVRRLRRRRTYPTGEFHAYVDGYRVAVPADSVHEAIVKAQAALLTGRYEAVVEASAQRCTDWLMDADTPAERRDAADRALTDLKARQRKLEDAGLALA